MSIFQTALSGLQAASTDLQVMGNNISNANTVGFKESNAQFADAYASAIAGTAPQAGQIGIGTTVQTVAQQFSQGNIQTTSNPLDVAINGTGFFQFNYNGATVYGRNGQFQLNQNGYIVDAAGGQSGSVAFIVDLLPTHLRCDPHLECVLLSQWNNGPGWQYLRIIRNLAIHLHWSGQWHC
jgi:flagellar hook-basal body protein